MRIVIIGLSITSSWGNGHATTYRGLVRHLAARGHDVVFLERDVPWYAAHRDVGDESAGQTHLYGSLSGLHNHLDEVRTADVVIVGSYVPEGRAVGEWVTRIATGVTAFYDIDTPITMAALADDASDYISRALVPRYDMYLSFTGGPTLDRLEREFGARMARPLYCSVDPEVYFPEPGSAEWDLGYLGTYSDDRQPALDELLLQPAQMLPNRRFAVAGAQYPASMEWPANVTHTPHLPPARHRAFYNAQRYTLNVTRLSMIHAGWSPSVRLFEAAACATAIISDYWEGLDAFFEPDSDILIARSADDTLSYLRGIPEAERRAIGERARQRVLAAHTAAHRAAELEALAQEVRDSARA
jgi:spore maturation protein CgeB